VPDCQLNKVKGSNFSLNKKYLNNIRYIARYSILQVYLVTIANEVAQFTNVSNTAITDRSSEHVFCFQAHTKLKIGCNDRLW